MDDRRFLTPSEFRKSPSDSAYFLQITELDRTLTVLLRLCFGRRIESDNKSDTDAACMLSPTDLYDCNHQLFIYNAHIKYLPLLAVFHVNLD